MTLKMSFVSPSKICGDTLIAGIVSSVDGDTFITSRGATDDGSGVCAVGFDLSEAEGLKVESLILAKGNADLDVDFADEAGTFSSRCNTKDGRCH